MMKFPKNEVPKCTYTDYNNEEFVVTQNQITMVFVLYKKEKDGTLTKLKSNQTPDEYDKFIYSSNPTKQKTTKTSSGNKTTKTGKLI